MQRLRDPDQRRLQPGGAELRRAVLDRIGGEADVGDRDVDEGDQRDGREHAARQVDARALGLLGHVGHGLQPRVGEHRERKREQQRVPARARAHVQPVREGGGGRQQDEAEAEQQQLREHVEPGDDDPDRVEARPPDEPDEADADDGADADDDVPRPPAERADLERPGEIVGEEERRERHHDQVVEEQHPASHEAGDVVERLADEGRRTARLGDRRRSLGVGERDDEEEDADREQDGRRQAERLLRHDRERDVDRRGDLAVRHREQRRRAEHALEGWELPGHARSLVVRSGHLGRWR